MRKPLSQSELTLHFLIKKRSVTSIELREWTNSSYPPARIADIQRLGVRIIHDREKYNKKSIARYTLLSTIDKARGVLAKMLKEREAA